VKRLVSIVTIAILLVGLVLLGLSDTDISVADTSIPNDEVTSSVSKIYFHPAKSKILWGLKERSEFLWGTG
jgi:hypothetical protein